LGSLIGSYVEELSYAPQFLLWRITMKKPIDAVSLPA